MQTQLADYSKPFLFPNSVIKELTFDELYENFFNMIQNESWKLFKKIKNKISRDEIVQQFTIELWNAYEKYDISKGNCVSTYIYYRFMKAKSDIMGEIFYTSKKIFEKDNVVYFETGRSFNGGEDIDFYNNTFNSDNGYIQNNTLYQPDKALESNELFDTINSIFKDEEEKDIFLVIMDRKDFSVNDYSKKYGISRVAANNRVLKTKSKIAKFLKDNYNEEV